MTPDDSRELNRPAMAMAVDFMLECAPLFVTKVALCLHRYLKQTVLVTGGSGDIGGVTARRLAAAGKEVSSPKAGKDAPPPL